MGVNMLLGNGNRMPVVVGVNTSASFIIRYGQAHKRKEYVFLLQVVIGVSYFGVYCR